MTFSFLEKSITTSSESKRAAKEPSTIFGVFGELGPMLANNRLVPNDSFFSFISGKKIYNLSCASVIQIKYWMRITFERDSLPHDGGDAELLQHIRGRTPDEGPVPGDVLLERVLVREIRDFN